MVLAGELVALLGDEGMQGRDRGPFGAVWPNVQDLGRRPFRKALEAYPLQRRLRDPGGRLGAGLLDGLGGDLVGLHDHHRPVPRGLVNDRNADMSGTHQRPSNGITR